MNIIENGLGLTLNKFQLLETWIYLTTAAKINEQNLLENQLKNYTMII